jgi:hypothetical protein
MLERRCAILRSILYTEDPNTTVPMNGWSLSLSLCLILYILYIAFPLFVYIPHPLFVWPVWYSTLFFNHLIKPIPFLWTVKVLPWVCFQLRRATIKGSVHLQNLFFASSLLLDHFLFFHRHWNRTTNDHDERRPTQGYFLLLTDLPIFNLPWPAFAFCCFFFLGDWMATGIGSLALGLDEHVVRLGIGHRGLRKLTRNFFFRCIHFSLVDCVVNNVKEHSSLAHPLKTLPVVSFSIADQLYSFTP